MNNDEPITILPKLGNNRFNNKKHTAAVKPNIFNTKSDDPDVVSVLKQKNTDQLDILGMTHEPTKEESSADDTKPQPEKSSPWNWLIISLAFIVVVLIIVIVWYVLKENENICETRTAIPSSIIQPVAHRVAQSTRPHRYNHMREYQQTENLPILTKSMDSHTKKFNPSQPKPTKEELESTLKKLETIDEEPVVTEQKNKSLNSDSDDKLSSQFYNNLQQNIDIDEVDGLDGDVSNPEADDD
jgi:hypothetical protein